MNPEDNSTQATPPEENGASSNAPVQAQTPVETEAQTDTGQAPISAAPSQPIVPVDTVPAAPQPINQELFDQIVEKIIEQQEAIIGPVAVEQAKKVHELKIDWPQHDVDIDGNPQQAIDELVKQYQELFGQIAVQVSKEAVAAIMAQLPADQQPKSLQ